MISMQEIRKKYPQYDDMSDQQLADSLHKKYYSDMPQDQFYQKIGMQPQNVLRGTSEQTQNNPKSTWQDYVYNMAHPIANLARHTTANALTLGRDYANIPHMFFDKLPEFGKQDDYFKQLGVEEGIADQLAREAYDYVSAGKVLKGTGKLLQSVKNPVISKAVQQGEKLINKAPNLAENVGTGALVSAYHAPEGERLKEAAIGAGLGGVATGIGKGIEAGIVQPLAGWYAKSAIPGLIEKGTEKLKGLGQPEEYTQQLKNIFSSTSQKNASNWDKTNALAKSMDDSLPKTREIGISSSLLDKNGNPLTATAKESSYFNSTPYDSYINKYISDINNYSPAKKEQYKEALEFAKEVKNLSPQSFEDTVLLRQNLNQYLDDFTTKRGLTKSDKIAENFVKELKNKLINDTVKANSNKVDPNLFSKFEESWKNANKSHQELQKFYQSPDKAGSLDSKQLLRAAFKQNEFPDPAILGEFLPKSSQTGIGGLKHLEQLFGSKEKMQEAAKSYYLRRIREDSSYGKDIVDLYGKLSPQQRSYLFGKDENKLLAVANKAALKKGRPEENKLHPSLHHGLSYGVSGALGALGAYSLGMPWHEAILAGGVPAALGYKGLQKGIGKYASAHPESILKALERAEQGKPNRGRMTNFILQSLGRGE